MYKKTYIYIYTTYMYKYVEGSYGVFFQGLLGAKKIRSFDHKDPPHISWLLEYRLCLGPEGLISKILMFKCGLSKAPGSGIFPGLLLLLCFWGAAQKVVLLVTSSSNVLGVVVV